MLPFIWEELMSANTKANDYLKECMADALIDLMKVKPFNKITIDEIASKAEVHRTTWYRNFTSKGEMITFKLIRLWDSWGKNHGVVVKEGFNIDNADPFYRFNYEIKDLLKLITDANLSGALYEAFYQTLKPKFEDSVAEGYKARFYSYGLLGVLNEWIDRDFSEKPEDMINMSREVIIR